MLLTMEAELTFLSMIWMVIIIQIFVWQILLTEKLQFLEVQEQWIPLFLNQELISTPTSQEQHFVLEILMVTASRTLPQLPLMALPYQFWKITVLPDI